jgi:SRSO17 transposase
MHADQERLERFVRESPWDHANVKTELRERVPEAVQGDDTALIVDGMGVPKAGIDSVGVSRQWCGATGKIDNCQVTVNCTLARPGERHNTDQVTWPLGMRLYLSKKWADAADADYDSQQEREHYAQKRDDTTLSDNIEYQSKRDLAVESLEQIAATDLDYSCLVADNHFGGSRRSCSHSDKLCKLTQQTSITRLEQRVPGVRTFKTVSDSEEIIAKTASEAVSI